MITHHSKLKYDEIIKSVFSSLLPSILPSYEFRQQQYLMSEKVFESLQKDNKLIIEAPTGVGKSLGYLIPSIIFQKANFNENRIIVSTYTKTLQQQLVSKDLPLVEKVIEEIFGEKIKYLYLYGGENYLCLSKFNDFCSSSSLELDEKVKISEIKDWLKNTETGCVEEIEIDANLWTQINRESDLCRGKKCHFYSECYYYNALKKIRDAEVIILNHHLFFANLTHLNKILPKKSSICEDIIIFDEAHNLEEVALEWLGTEIANTQIKFLCKQIYNPRKKRGLVSQLSSLSSGWKENLISVVMEVLSSTGQFFSELVAKLPQKNEVRIYEPHIVEDCLTEPLGRMLSVLKSALNVVKDDNEEFKLRAFANRVVGFISVLNFWLSCEDKNYIYWVEKEDKVRSGLKISLKTTPLEIALDMQQKIYSEYNKIIFTSATLSVNKNLEFFKKSVGLIPQIIEFNKVEEIVLNSPFNYQDNVVIYLPESSIDLKKEELEYRNFVFKTIKELLDTTKGNTFVLFTSFDLMKWVFSQFNKEGNVDYNIFVQKGSKYKLLEKYKNTENSVLFGVDTFWQGVDIPGEKLISIIIPRLPFDVPQHPVIEAKIEKIKMEGGDAFLEYSLPNAILKLKQGFGRLIRRKTDWGIVTIIDPRIKTRWYGKYFLSSLPDCKITTSFSEVKKFYRERK